ncbi:DUF6663 family protein [Halorussus litoreus]|uniref:DUF6663 family protein n=1 Tax=Halorussus litoreus TaxID=1710536 RepID=UPI001E37C1E1|nr:DUF6663 family protein [Halorussus litoreus]
MTDDRPVEDGWPADGGGGSTDGWPTGDDRTTTDEDDPADAGGRPTTDDGSSTADGDQPAEDDDQRTADDRTPDDDPGYRVLGIPKRGQLRLLDLRSFEPVVTAAEGHEAPVGELRPGYLIDAELDWSSAEPTVHSVAVRRPTLYAFADEAEPIFEAARETWTDALAADEPMNSRVTRNTDSEVNGAVYVFAESGPNATFEEFRDGTRPLEPLVDRVNDSDGPAPREVFVLRPPEEEFVVVTIALRKGGQFADALRETYDLPRPPEPLA